MATCKFCKPNPSIDSQCIMHLCALWKVGETYTNNYSTEIDYLGIVSCILRIRNTTSLAKMKCGNGGGGGDESP